MKSILMGNQNVPFVYPPETLAALKAEADMEPKVVTKDEILADPAATADTEYIFATSLKSDEENPVTCIYEACTIPEIVQDEALAGTRSLDVLPFL